MIKDTTTGIDVGYDNNMDFSSVDKDYTNETFECIIPNTPMVQTHLWLFTIQLVIFKNQSMMRFRGKRNYGFFPMYVIKNIMSKMLTTSQAHSKDSGKSLHHLIKEFLDKNDGSTADVIASFDVFMPKKQSFDLMIYMTTHGYHVSEKLQSSWCEDIKSEISDIFEKPPEQFLNFCSKEISAHRFSEETEKLLNESLETIVCLDLYANQNGTIGITCSKINEQCSVNEEILSFPPVVAVWDAVSNIYAQDYADLISSRLSAFEKSALVQTYLQNLVLNKTPMTQLMIRKSFSEKHAFAIIAMGITRTKDDLVFSVSVEEVVAPMMWITQLLCECMKELNRNVSPIFTGVSR